MSIYIYIYRESLSIVAIKTQTQKRHGR